MDLLKWIWRNGFGEIILAKLGIWRSDLVRFKDLVKVFLAKFMDLVKLFWPNWGFGEVIW